MDYFLRYDETAWSTQDPAIQDEDGDSEVRQDKFQGVELEFRSVKNMEVFSLCNC